MPDEWEAPELREARTKAHKEMLLKVHGFLGAEPTVRIYELVKARSCPIPGTITGKRGGTSRRENFEQAVAFYPFLFRIQGSVAIKLDLDPVRLEALIDECGREDLGGGLEDWGATLGTAGSVARLCRP